jgi:SpoVK/Ycf46/Vps4 family AAA+-type ATPase
MKRKMLIVLFLLLVTGCGTRFFYYQLDWLIPYFLRDYISLNSEQKSILKERLLKQIDWHCKTQLADYSETLRSLSKDISDSDHPIDYDKLNDYYTKFRGFWAELIRQVAPDIAEILRTATNSQIEELFDNLDKRNDELRAEYIDLPPEELLKQREERMIKGLRKWLSDPMPEQKQAVSTWVKQLKPIGQEWMQYRDKIQEEVVNLLKQRKELPDFDQKLIESLTHPERMRSSAYQTKSDYNRDITLKLGVNIIHLMTPGQRSHLLKRIDSFANDFEKIKCND